MARHRTAVQETRCRVYSIKKPQANDIKEPDTETYDRWGRTKGDEQ